MEQNHLFSFLKNVRLFSGYTDEEIHSLLPLIKTSTFHKGAYFFKEGDTGEYLYVIVKGKVEILKKDPEAEEEHHFVALGSSEWFGEMLLLGDKVRAASARAEEETEVILIPLKELSSSRQGMANLATETAHRLRKTNEIALGSFKEELQLVKTHDHMGQFIVHLFILLTVYFYLLKMFNDYNFNDFLKNTMASLLIIAFGISAAILVKKSEYPLDYYGLTLKNWKRNAYEAVIFSIPLLIFIFFLKWALISFVPIFKHNTLFQFASSEHPFLYFFHTTTQNKDFYLFIGLYIVLVPIQEFIARGCLQSVLQQFFVSSNKVILAILTSSLLFGMFHGLKTFSFAGVAFLLGIFWGWLYARQKSIVGPTISHILIGAWGFGVLGYENILI